MPRNCKHFTDRFFHICTELCIRLQRDVINPPVNTFSANGVEKSHTLLKRQAHDAIARNGQILSVCR